MIRLLWQDRASLGGYLLCLTLSLTVSLILVLNLSDVLNNFRRLIQGNKWCLNRFRATWIFRKATAVLINWFFHKGFQHFKFSNYKPKSQQSPGKISLLLLLLAPVSHLYNLSKLKNINKPPRLSPYSLCFSSPLAF